MRSRYPDCSSRHTYWLYNILMSFTSSHHNAVHRTYQPHLIDILHNTTKSIKNFIVSKESIVAPNNKIY